MAKKIKNHKSGKIFLTVILFVLFLALVLILPNGMNDSDFEVEVLITGLDTPWAIDFLPDNRLIFTERPGRINIFDGKNTIRVAQIPISEVQESGLLGIAVDPSFENNNFIYLFYSYKEGEKTLNRISRFTLKNNKISNEFILLDAFPGAWFHDGGRLKFGPDGKLYATTGDAAIPDFSQDLDSLAGKILRLNKDGSIPDDNPFNNLVYSYGHRNPQGIAWHPATGVLFAAEHGPSKNDELNLIEAGKNYGWPEKCEDYSGEFVSPLRCYSEFTLAPSGIAFFDNKLYIGGLRGQQVRELEFDDNFNIISEKELFTNLGRIRDIIAHDEYLYIATSNRDGRGIPKLGDDKIIRLKKR